MIDAIIVIAAEGVVILVLAGFHTAAILSNNRLERDNQALQRAVQEAQTRAAQWSDEATRVAQENDTLKAHITDLEAAQASKPSSKRVRRNGTPAKEAEQ